MHIGILSRRPDVYSTKRLVEAAEERGHRVMILDTHHCYMNITAGKLSIHHEGEQLSSFDAIIPRIGGKNSFYGISVVRQFETMGTFSLNPSLGITRARDKLRALQLLARKGIDLPITGFAYKHTNVDDLIKMVGVPPLIIKLLEGTQGIGVVLAETKKAAQSVIQAFLGVKVNIVVQEYIKESKGSDIRCFVLGNEVIAAIKRQGSPEDFRANLHRGGTATVADITPAETFIAIEAAKIMGLNLAGVDIIRSERGPLVLEVNASPGLEGIEKATQKDIALLIIQYIENNAQPITAKMEYHL